MSQSKKLEISGRKMIPLLLLSLIVLTQLTNGIGCEGRNSEFDPLITADRGTAYSHVKRMDVQEYQKPSPLPPLEINIDNIESNITRIGVWSRAEILPIGADVGRLWSPGIGWGRGCGCRH